MLEVVWTLVPVLILVAIAVPSIRLLAHQYAPPRADLTVKVTGNQWYWTYEYPDNGVELRPRKHACPTRRPTRARRAPPARGRQSAGGPGRRRGEADHHLHRRHPRLGRPRLLDQDGRRPRPAQRDLVPGRARGRLLRRRATNCAAPATAICRSRSRWSAASAFAQWVALAGRPHAGRGAAAPQPAAAAPAAAPPTPRRPRRPRPTGNVTAGAETPATTNQSATTSRLRRRDRHDRHHRKRRPFRGRPWPS